MCSLLCDIEFTFPSTLLPSSVFRMLSFQLVGKKNLVGESPALNRSDQGLAPFSLSRESQSHGHTGTGKGRH